MKEYKLQLESTSSYSKRLPHLYAIQPKRTLITEKLSVLCWDKPGPMRLRHTSERGQWLALVLPSLTFSSSGKVLLTLKYPSGLPVSQLVLWWGLPLMATANRG